MRGVELQGQEIICVCSLSTPLLESCPGSYSVFVDYLTPFSVSYPSHLQPMTNPKSLPSLYIQSTHWNGYHRKTDCPRCWGRGGEENSHVLSEGWLKKKKKPVTLENSGKTVACGVKSIPTIRVSQIQLAITQEKRKQTSSQKQFRAT